MAVPIWAWAASPQHSAAAASESASERGSLTAGAVEGFAPHYVVDARGRATGFAVDVMDEVARRAGLDVRYRVFGSWREANDALVAGRIDLVPNMGITEARRALGHFSMPYETLRVGLFIRAGAQHIDALDELRGRAVGAVATNVAVAVLSARAGVTPQTFPTLGEALRALLDGEIEVLAYPLPAVRHLARAWGEHDAIEPTGPALQDVERGLIVAKDRAPLLARLEPHLRDFTQSARFHDLHRRWFGPPQPRLIFGWHWIVGALAGLGLFAVLVAIYRRSVAAEVADANQARLERRLWRRTVAIAAGMNLAAVAVALIALFYLYWIAFDETRTNLTESAGMQAALIEAVARYDRDSLGDPAAARRATLRQITEGLGTVRGKGEIQLAERKGDSLSFLLRQHAARPFAPAEIALGGDLAKPMQWALSGQSGTDVALDYRGETVLAAYRPVEVLDLGFVVMMDLAEIQAPFVRAALVVVAATVGMALLATLGYFRMTLPITRHLLRGETRFRDFAQITADWFWETDMDQRFTYLTPVRIYGVVDIRSEEWLGKTRRAVHEALGTKPDFAGIVQSFMDRGEAFDNVRLRFVDPERGEAWIGVSGAPVYETGDRIVGYRGIGRDVTADVRRERELEESEERFRQIAENIREVFWMSDPEKQEILYVSPAYEQIWGWPRETLYERPRSFVDPIHPDDRDRIAAAIENQAIETYDEEYRIVRPDGTERWIRDRAFPVADDGGKIYRVVGVAEDITDDKERERRLLQAQKLESIGRLTGGIAHDFNNLLQAILANVDLIRLRELGDREAAEPIDSIERAALRAAALTDRMLTFARQKPLTLKMVDVNACIVQMEHLLKPSLGEDIVIELRLRAQPALVLTDEDYLEASLLNLAVNARDAMPKGGRFVIETGVLEIREAAAGQDAELAPGRYVAITTSDTGSGIPPDELQRVFEPFFTTKDPGKGTGLGLAMVYGFAMQSGGRATIHSELGSGTTVRIYLPYRKEVEARLAPSPSGAEAS